MTLEEFKKKELPDEPGVYFFKDDSGTILYIGKATSLRSRVRSYFSPDLLKTRGNFLVEMIVQATDVIFTQTDSVLEALLLEANLIKLHQPKYNTKDKDNKSSSYVVITNDIFPKVLTMRGRTLFSEQGKHKYVFGPFPNGGQLREAMKIIRRIFPYTDDKCVPCAVQMERPPRPSTSSGHPSLEKEGKQESCRPCFNRQIGLCPGVCTGEISQEDYAERIKNIKLFFEGKKKVLLHDLEASMKEHAEKREFERAHEIKNTIFALTHIQDIALLKHEHKLSESSGGEFNDSAKVFRIEAYDIAHSSGKHVVGVMTVMEDGEIKKADYRKFRIRINPGVNDTAALKEILRRRFGHFEWRLPSLIVVDGGQAQINAAEAVLKERGVSIDVVSVVKDARHKPRDIMGSKKAADEYAKQIVLANSEAHRFAVAYHRSRRDRLII